MSPGRLRVLVLRRALPLVVGAGILLLVCAVVLVALLPAWLNTPALRAQVEAELSRLAGQPVGVESLEVHAWPHLEVVARGITVGADTARAEAVFIAASWDAVRHGRMETRDIRVVGPRVVLDLPIATAPRADADAGAARQEQPGFTIARLQVENGTVVLRWPGGVTEEWRDVNIGARNITPAAVEGVEVAGRCGEQSLRARGAVVFGDPWDISLDVEAVGWKPGAVLGAFGIGTEPVVSADIVITGNATFRQSPPVRSGTWDLSAVQLQVQGGRGAWKGAVHSAGTARVEDGVVTVERATLGSGTTSVSGRAVVPAAREQLELHAAGTLAWTDVVPLLRALDVQMPRGLRLGGAGELGVEIAQGRAAVELGATATDVAWVKVANKARGQKLTLRAAGTLASLTAAAWKGDATFEGVEVFLPGHASTLRGVGAHAAWDGRRLKLEELVATLGEGALDGQLAWQSAARGPGSLSGTLHATRVDLDELARSSEPANPVAADGDADGPAPEPPGLDVKLSVDHLSYERVVLTRVSGHLQGAGGEVALRDLKAAAWEGAAAGAVVAQARKRPVTYAARVTLRDASMDALLGELAGRRGAMKGRADVQWDLAGKTGQEAARHVTGTGQLDIRDIDWAGARAFNALAAPLSAAVGTNVTALDMAGIRRIHGPWRVQDRKLHADGLVMERTNGATLLAGWIDFDGNLDFSGRMLMNAEASALFPRQADALRNRHNNVVIPFIMRGTVDKPIVTLDAARIGRDVIQKELGVVPGGALQPLQDKAIDEGARLLKGVFGGRK